MGRIRCNFSTYFFPALFFFQSVPRTRKSLLRHNWHIVGDVTDVKMILFCEFHGGMCVQWRCFYKDVCECRQLLPIKKRHVANMRHSPAKFHLRRELLKRDMNFHIVWYLYVSTGNDVGHFRWCFASQQLSWHSVSNSELK